MPAYILTTSGGGGEYLFTLQILSGELGMLTTHLHKDAKPRIQRTVNLNKLWLQMQIHHVTWTS